MSVKVGLIISCLALISSLISIVIPYWISILDGTVSGYGGLWKLCVNSEGSFDLVCSDISESPDWFNAVRALMIIGAACLAIGILTAFYGVKSKQTVKSAGFVVALGGNCCIVAAIVYGAEYASDGAKHLHAGFGLALAAGVVSIVGGVCLVKANIGSPGYSSIQSD